MATKVLLRDENNVKLLPITRGELVLDSSGGVALHSDEFLATASLPGLMSPSEKTAINNMKSTVVDDSLSTTSENPVQNKIITLVINETLGLLNGIKEKYLKSANTTTNRLTLVDQDDSEINFYNTTYNVVTNTAAGLAPLIVTATEAIQHHSDEWVLTSKNGETPTWKKLPINAFRNDNSDTTYSINGQLSGNNYIITLKDSSDKATTAVISPFTGSTVSSDGLSGIVPSPTILDRLKFLRGDGTWAAMLQVELSWDNILNKPETFKPEAHFHSTNHISDLLGYNIASDKYALEESDTLNAALGKLEYKTNLGVTAYDWYRSVTGEDTDDIINKWGEIVDFIGGITEDTDILSKFVTTDTALTITGVKTFSSRISFPANTGIYYNNQFELLGVASKGNWTGHPGNANYYTFIGTPSYDTILRAKDRLYSYRNGLLYEIIDSGNLSSITKLNNFYSSRPSNLKPAIIGDGSMYQFKSTSAASSLTDYPGDGHILNFEWDNDDGYSSQLFIRNHDGLLKTRGMNGKDANGNAKWSLWTTLLSNYNYNNLLPVKLVNGLGYSDMIAAGYLRSDYVSAGYPAEDYLKALCLLLINSYKGCVCIGSVRPSTGGSYICYVYDTTINTSTGLPEYMVGTAFLFNGIQISFGTVTGNWYYRQTLNNTNYSNYTLPKLESMQFTKTSTYVNATLVDPEVRKLALGSGYIEFCDSAVSPNTTGWFNSHWGKIRTKFGYESESKISLLGTTADTSWISFNRTGEGANYITWPGESSALCLLAFGYGNQYDQSYYYMSSKALYPAQTSNTLTLGTLSNRWDTIFAKKGNYVGDITLYSASGDSPHLVFLRTNLDDGAWDWDLYVSGGVWYLRQNSVNNTPNKWLSIISASDTLVNIHKNLYIVGDTKLDGSLHKSTDTTSGMSSYLASFNSTASSVTGIIKITLPTSWSSAMAMYEIKIYEYNSYAGSTLLVSGYNYSGGSYYNIKYTVAGMYNKSVRFAHDGTNCCILLGNTDSTWSYPLIFLSNVYGGYSGGKSVLKSGYKISVITSESGLTGALYCPKATIDATTATRLVRLTPVDASHTLYYYSGQPDVGDTTNKAKEGSNAWNLFSYPAGGTLAGIVANIMSLRMLWSTLYLHEIFASPNNRQLWHRWINSGTPKSWSRIVLEDNDTESYTYKLNIDGKTSKIALNGIDNLTTYGDYGGIIQSSKNGPIDDCWYNSLKILYNNSEGYYTQLALNFTGEEGLWHRRCTKGIETEWKKVIDSSNIGSQSVSHATTTERFKLVISNSGDLNTALSSGGLARNCNSGMASGFTNAPTGSSLGMVLQLTAFANSNALAGQLAWDVNHNSTTDTTRYLWWRAGDSVSGFTKSVWHKIAFTDACLSINKKINIGGGSELVPITDIITKTGGYSLTKTLFYYMGNGYTTATKPDGTHMAYLDLAGASILTFGASGSEYTHLFITAPTQAEHNGITNEMLFYLNHGSGYSPGWTRVLTNRNYESIVVGDAGVDDSDFTDGTQLLSSYASDYGFSSSGYVNKIYKRKASSMFNYIKTKAAIDANAFTSYTSKYLKVYTKSNSLNYPILFAGGIGSSGGTDRSVCTDSVSSLYYNPSSNILTSSRFASTVATGTAPMTISSTTVVTNLNADMVDGKHASDFAIPVGTIMMWPMSTPPTGWLLCDGSAVSRTTYSTLFAVISTNYGSGDGSTTFNLPKFSGRFPLGAGRLYANSTHHALRTTGGAETVTLTSALSGLRGHTHKVFTTEGSGYSGSGYDYLTKTVSAAGWSGGYSLKASGSGDVNWIETVAAENATNAHENMPPYLTINFIIKY